MPLTPIEFDQAIKNRQAWQNQLVEMSTRITNHGLYAHPRLLDCPTCLPWLIKEQQLKNRIESIEKLLSASNQ